MAAAAAHSPVVVNSSPQSLRITSISPPSVHHETKSPIAISSSPKLPSPSTFARPRLQAGLKSGSKGQQLPEGVKAGFASAGALWKRGLLVKDDAVAESDMREDGRASKRRKPSEDGDERTEVKKRKEPPEGTVELEKSSTGKVARPRKKVKPVKDADDAGVKSPLLKDFADEEKREPPQVTDHGARMSSGKLVNPRKNIKQTEERINGAVNSPVLQDCVYEYSTPIKHAHNACDDILSGLQVPAPRVHSPSISLSEYTFQVPPGDERKEPVKKPVKKARKKAANALGHEGTKKKAPPRKRKKKSESIVLNSDEPEPAENTAVEANHTMQPKQQDGDVERIPIDDINSKKSDLRMARNAKQSEQLEQSVYFEDAKRTDYDRSEEQSTYFRRTGTPAPESEAALATKTHSAPGPAAAIIDIEESAYFSKPATAVLAPPTVETTPGDVTIKPAGVHSSSEVEANETRHSWDAPTYQRRRDWTPAKNTTFIERPPTADSNASAASDAPRLKLTDILGGFNYISTDTVPEERVAPVANTTKKRRIEPTESTTKPKKTSKPSGEPKRKKKASEGVEAVAKVKKVKAPKKKAQTITAMATAAFQPPPPDNATVEGEQITVSEFFTPTKVFEAPIVVEQAGTKPKKPRKPRAPKSNAADASAKSKKTSRPKKVKIKEADYRPRLHSPARASAQMQSQAFLFGTSSQLAPDEAPQFIRDMQAAMQESESIQAAQRYEDGSQLLSSQVVGVSPVKSCARVPTAPHGTCLSVEQARRELWCVASRDKEGAILGKVMGDTRTGVSAPERQTTDVVDFAEPRVEVQLERENQRLDALDLALDIVKPYESATLEDSVMDLCNSSPPGEVENFAKQSREDLGSVEQECEPGRSAEEMQAHRQSLDTDNSDDWMLLLSSDGPVPAATEKSDVPPPPPQTGPLDGIESSPQKSRTSTLLGTVRPALMPLDANVSLPTHVPPSKGPAPLQPTRLFSSIAADQSRKDVLAARPRGRPRKDALSPATTQTSPRKRGRPPKSSQVFASEPSPRLGKSKKAKTKSSALQPAVQSEWLNIDEISDSDSPNTPSPPRRRASSSPPAMKPLELGPSQIDESTRAAPVSTSVKPDGPQWPAMRAILFPRITSIVKSSTKLHREHDPEGLSWWSKMLLYDPIVVEDLTAWLNNNQGLRVELRKPVPKKKGRRKKEDDAAEKDWELHQEPLQPWMVQKWCEEKSVCCYCREGSWRAGRK